jgi:plastocyanin
MRLAVAALVAAIAVAVAAPLPSGAAPAATPSAKHRCKHKAKHRGKHKRAKHHNKRKKRCRRKGAAGTTPTGEKPGKNDKPGQPTKPSGPPGRLLATSLEISPTQLQLQLSRASVAAGTTIVEQYNSGADPHNLILERQGVVAFSLPTLGPGGDQRQTLNLTPGTWTLYCSLLNHRALGMQATLTVN